MNAEIKKAKFEIFKRAGNMPDDGINDSENFDMHLSTVDNEFTDEELNFELEDKFDLISRLFKREIPEEDHPSIHLT